MGKPARLRLASADSAAAWDDRYGRLRALPGELEDAAIVHGATRSWFFLRILLPLSRPALITVGGLVGAIRGLNQVR